METIYSAASNADQLEAHYDSQPEFEKALQECQTGNPLAAMMIAESVVDGYFDPSQSLATSSPANSPGRKKGRSLIYEGADQSLVQSVGAIVFKFAFLLCLHSLWIFNGRFSTNNNFRVCAVLFHSPCMSVVCCICCSLFSTPPSL